jgi:hypothetical protein
LIGRKTAVDGIDAEGEELVEMRIEGGQVAQTLIEQIAVERFQMANVKHDPVALADRPFIQKFGFDDGEQRVSDVTRVDQTLDKRVTRGGVAIHFAGSPCGGTD